MFWLIQNVSTNKFIIKNKLFLLVIIDLYEKNIDAESASYELGNDRLKWEGRFWWQLIPYIDGGWRRR